MINMQPSDRTSGKDPEMPMLLRDHVLSGKMRIALSSGKPGRPSPENVCFYMRYASFVFRVLKKPSFQKFLRWMLRKEAIEERMIEDVQVRVLPFKRKNGKGLAGNCNIAEGRVRIYPRTLTSCRRLIQESGKAMFLSYVRIRARAALIHELLHLKYSGNEEKVRRLTREYFTVFARGRHTPDSQVSFVFRMLFK